jgi:glycosyltransferase involved in cell wall biosynthesis
LLEAMACGCAIVASDTAPLQEVIQTETGVLTPFFEPQTLSRRKIELLGDDAKRKQLGVAARKLAV